VLMCAVPGYDASGRVDDLATELNKQMTSIAIGEYLVVHLISINLIEYSSLLPLYSISLEHQFKCEHNIQQQLQSDILRFRLMGDFHFPFAVLCITMGWFCHPCVIRYWVYL